MLIEINLAPGASAAKLRGKRVPSLTLPAMPALGANSGALAGGAAALLVLGLAAFGYLRMGAHETSLQSQIQQEVADSARLATTIELMRSVQARQDTIQQKIGVIRSVDTRRFVWPHLLDEISFAVPAYTWIYEINSKEPAGEEGSAPIFTIQGNAGSTQALTRFMKNLEGSAFIREVTLVTTAQEVVEGRTIQRFGLEAHYRVPDASAIRTTPILVLD